MSNTDEETATVAGELLSVITEQLAADESSPLQPPIPVTEDTYADEAVNVDDKAKNDAEKVDDDIGKVYEAVKIDDEAMTVNDEAVKVDDEATKVDDEAVKVDIEAMKVDEESVKVDDEPVKVDEEAVKVDDEPVKVDDGTILPESVTLASSGSGSNDGTLTLAGIMDNAKEDNDDPTKATSTTTTLSTLRNNPRLRKLVLVVAILGLIVGIVAIVSVVLASKQKNNSTVSSSLSGTNSDPTKNDNDEQPPNEEGAAPDIKPLLSDSPSLSPTARKTYSPTGSSRPSSTPTISAYPSSLPTAAPTITASPTGRPSISPTTQPTTTVQPTTTTSPTVEAEVTTFYAIGDVPYAPQELVKLRGQMMNITEDAEFVIHVGDMRFAQPGLKCIESEFTSVSDALRLSRAPVFIVIGDNDWVDCANPDEGLRLWNQEFFHFHDRYWNHSFNVRYQPERPMNFNFIHKGTLFFGLNIIGGKVKNFTEWNERLSSEIKWTLATIREFVASVRHANTTSTNTAASNETNSTNTNSDEFSPRIVIFGQANPFAGTNPFFNPLVDYIRNEVHNSIPILYLNGDKHVWEHNPDYMGQPSFLQIIVNAKAEDPPLQVRVHANGRYEGPFQAFPYDRMLPPGNRAYGLTYDQQNALGHKKGVSDSNRE